VVRRSSRNFLVVLIICLVALAGAGALRLLRPLALTAAAAVPSGGSLVSSLRSEPKTFNRFVDRGSAAEVITVLTHARLVRINRVTMDLEPMLAESWTRSPDNLTYTLKLRRGVKFSDGTPFTSADVVFSFRAAYDEKAKNNVIGDTLRVQKQPLQVTAVDANTVSIRFPSVFGPGLRILDNLPIYPQHLLQRTLDDGTFGSAWDTATPPAKLAGLGPFVLREYQVGQRLVFDRNPNYWRTDASGARLPYLDRITLEIIKEQNAEVLRLQSGQIDCMPSEIRSEDYALLKQAASTGQLRLHDLGVGLDADWLAFNLRKDAKMPEGRRAWLQHVELRRAIAEAVDRKRFVDVVFLGAAVPVFGPVSPANKLWFDNQVPTPGFDRARAAGRLASIGLKNKGADGVLVDAGGQPARITLITQKGNTALERGASVIRDDLKTIGLAVDVVPLDQGALVDRMMKGDFELIYFRFLTTDLDPAGALDFWLSSGSGHLWNPGQTEPATDWERRVDDLMARQVASVDDRERKRLFGEVQRVFADQLPIVYFAAPRVFVATSSRVLNATPVLMRPVVLWSAETLAVQKRAGTN
jgi:peptide/nickel transport system substrate-binding protein